MKSRFGARKFTDTQKWCPKCEVWKEHKEFYKGPGISGLSSYCKICNNLYVQSLGSVSRKAENQAIYNRRRHYGLSNEQYLNMWNEQGGLCAVGCGRPIYGVDHDHKTTKVRALLCRMCNMTLGSAQDDRILLGNLIAYLEKFEKIDA